MVAKLHGLAKTILFLASSVANQRRELGVTHMWLHIFCFSLSKYRSFSGEIDLNLYMHLWKSMPCTSWLNLGHPRESDSKSIMFNHTNPVAQLVPYAMKTPEIYRMEHESSVI